VENPRLVPSPPFAFEIRSSSSVEDEGIFLGEAAVSPESYRRGFAARLNGTIKPVKTVDISSQLSDKLSLWKRA
jgi:hypothetical protein